MAPENLSTQNLNIDVEENIKCKRAQTLHQKKCTVTDNRYGCLSEGYSNEGSKGTDKITYGNCGTIGILTSGDAFTCDVNNDGIFNEENERFYYVSDYYNDQTTKFKADTATLVYYSNVKNGSPVLDNRVRYFDSGYYAPYNAIKQLPTISQWSNSTLKYSGRQITTTSEYNSVSGSKLPSKFNYYSYGARFLSMQEIEPVCSINIVPTIGKEHTLLNCLYLLENTSFDDGVDYWLENIYDSNDATIVNGYNLQILNSNKTFEDGVRPVIDVAKSQIEYGANESSRYHTMKFNPNEGSLTQNYQGTINDNPIGSLPTPTPSNEKEFVGWFTGLTDGIQIDENYILQSDIEVYARYKNAS